MAAAPHLSVEEQSKLLIGVAMLYPELILECGWQRARLLGGHCADTHALSVLTPDQDNVTLESWVEAALGRSGETDPGVVRGL
jgi:hypothetical protein